MKGLVGTYVDQRRTELSISKTELAQRVGISRQALHKLISGDIETTSIKTLMRLSAALNLHPSSLMEQMVSSRGLSSYQTHGAIAPGDGTSFIGDLTYPDNSVVLRGERFTKIWRSRNTGRIPWENRFMKCFDDEIKLISTSSRITVKNASRGIVPHSYLIELPTIKVGEYIDIEVHFLAPDYPCKAVSYWKMVDAEGNVSFPESEGLTCLVQVI